MLYIACYTIDLDSLLIWRSIIQVSLSLTAGGQKSSPHQKWLTWVIMAINNQNVNEIFVFIFTCVVVCKPMQYLQFLVKHFSATWVEIEKHIVLHSVISIIKTY